MKKKLKRVFSINLKAGYRNYTVRDLIELKGKKKLTQINVTSVEEAIAAEEAGIDLIIAGPPAPLKKIREAAPNTFFTVGLSFLEHESKESIVKKSFELMEMGADSIHCGSWNINFIKYLSEFKIPIQGHVGFVPMRNTWTGGIKPFGKRSDEAIQIYKDMKEIEEIGAWAVEVECVPKEILNELNKKTKMVTISIGSGDRGDVQFLFAEDILGHSLIDTPRHAKVYRNFNKVFETLQKERIGAFKEFRKDVLEKKYPTKKNSIDIDKRELIKFQNFLKEDRD
jgi:3-methyl-2-oxobutanoate hydroxymethyltransferase